MGLLVFDSWFLDYGTGRAAKDGAWKVNHMEESNNRSDREQALADLRRLTGIILDNLAEGSRNKLLDSKEVRLMTLTAMRTIRLFVKTLEVPASTKADSTSESSVENQKVALEDQNKPGQE